MGLLDDAIREHLDLKRRRGADPAEVQRAEQEALGPVRRGPIGAEPPELVLDEAHRPEWGDDYEEALDATRAGETGGSGAHAEPDLALEPRSGVARGLFDDEADPFGNQGPVELDPPLSSPAGRRSAESSNESAPPPHRAPLQRDRLGETVEYNLDEALGEAGGGTEEPARPAAHKPPEGADEDPLEETPEFLQETPDHDRLWFEQRPPRDFDFDG